MSVRSERAGLGLVMVAAALWATVGIGAQLVPSSANHGPDVPGLARMAIAGPVILIAAVIILGPGALRRARMNMGTLAIFAASNAVFQIGLFRCFDLLGVTITVFLTVCLPPVLALIWSLVTQSERITRGSFLSLALAVVGLAMIAGETGVGVTLPASSGGLVTALVASVAFVIMTDAARALTRNAPPFLVAGTGLTLSGLVLACLLPMMGTGSLLSLGGILSDPALIWLVLYLGLGPTALAYICYCTGMARCRTAVVGLIASMIEPAVAAALAFWILADAPSFYEATGCLLMMAAMLVLWLTERGAVRPRPQNVPAGPLSDRA